MDNRRRVYYLVNLNQNYQKLGWESKGWDDYGIIYQRNLCELRSKIRSLKITSNNQTAPSYYQMKISCIKEEENELLTILSELEDVNYMKICS